ncbi:MAG: hypothetical protein SV062_13590, partial [Thermodesulfobacteriota bacterium]|nr:hypothetical protein [Thermodesulfobacteriota bacterium]
MVRLLIRVFSYTLAILFVMVLSLLVFLQSDFSRERIKRLIVYEIQNRMQCQLVLENIEGNILTNIILKRVKLNVGKEKIFDVHQIKINYFLPALFGRTLYIRDICLYRPRTALIKDKTENWNYQLLPLQNI